MIPTSRLFPSDRELTGCIIENEYNPVDPNAPGRQLASVWQVKFTGLARIVDLSNLAVKVDLNDKQNAEKYCIYLDRAYAGIVTERMRVKFNSNLLGENTAFVSTNTPSSITGYISRVVKPQAMSRIGKLELYVTTNN